ncbi:hypothetical protein BLNAU_8240 [Blattamonas nauphoetae]|uniref:Uncharacterized protein n=1 Tax=Blattamonas nauphoetae TaxID=2049346 RepID=A0ABQ9XZ79_9EUKA|nr:hypothetical protein BLNAU_8240 [Blattamonas nauphoetae]
MINEPQQFSWGSRFHPPMLTTQEQSSSVGQPHDERNHEDSKMNENIRSHLTRLETENDENKVRLCKELVIACLEDSTTSKDFSKKLVEEGILGTVALELRKTTAESVHIGLQVLCNTVLAVVSNRGHSMLERQFPQLLNLSQNENNSIAESAIEAVGLISQRLCTNDTIDEFLSSGILEWMVATLRTHKSTKVRKAIVSALGEVGFGLKMAVVRFQQDPLTEPETPTTPTHELNYKHPESLQTTPTTQNQPSVKGKRGLLDGYVSMDELCLLESVDWTEQPGDGSDFPSRCQRAVWMARAALTEVVQRDAPTKHLKDELKSTENDTLSETTAEDEHSDVHMTREMDMGVISTAGCICGLVFKEVFQIDKMMSETGLPVRGSDVDEMREEMNKMKETTRRKEEEMERMIETIRKNPSSLLGSIQILRTVFCDDSTWTQTGNKFTKSKPGSDWASVTFDHLLVSNSFHHSTDIEFQCVHLSLIPFSTVIGLFDPTNGSIPAGLPLSNTPTSLYFSVYYKNLGIFRKGSKQSEKHGKDLVAFTTGDEVMIEVDLVQHTCHLFVNDKQVKVFGKGIHSSLKLAVSLSAENDGFEVRSFEQVQQSKAEPLSGDVEVDFRS